MITKKDAELIRDVLAEAMAMTTTNEQRLGVMQVESMFTKAWGVGKLGFDQTITISKYTEKEDYYRAEIAAK